MRLPTPGAVVDADHLAAVPLLSAVHVDRAATQPVEQAEQRLPGLEQQVAVLELLAGIGGDVERDGPHRQLTVSYINGQRLQHVFHVVTTEQQVEVAVDRAAAVDKGDAVLVHD